MGGLWGGTLGGPASGGFYVGGPNIGGLWYSPARRHAVDVDHRKLDASRLRKVLTYFLIYLLP